MACYRCGNQVPDREALREMVEAIIAGDMPLARILGGRAFTGDDREAIDSVLARAAVKPKAAV